MAAENFVNKVLSFLHKDEKQKQKDAVINFQKRAILDCKNQIGQREHIIEGFKLDKELAQNIVDSLKEKLEEKRFSIYDSFAEYSRVIFQAKVEIASAEEKVANIDAKITDTQTEIEGLKEMLEDLK